MATLYSDDVTGVLDGTLPASKADGSVYDARVRRYRAKITLASQTTSDTILLAKPRKGSVFAYGVMTTSATLGTSTVSIGTTDDADGYRAAATFTTANTPTFFGHTAGLGEGDLDGETEVHLTIATANLPASGTLYVDLYYSHS